MEKRVREELPKARRLVVKVGTKLLCGNTGQLDMKRMRALTHDLAEVWKHGREVVLVSSGAIGAGVGRLGLSRVPQTIPEKQAAAAVGQGILMHLYEKLFAQEGIVVAQVLLTREDITNRMRYLNARNTLETLFHYKVIPIVNENDTVAVEEIRFGDNDTLAALVACVVDADLLVLLTDMEGFFTRDPHKSGEGKLIHQIEEITPEIEALAGGKGSPLATGGMETKIQAAKITMEAGIPLIIASGLHEGTLLRILEGEEVGTLFVPRHDRMQARKRWIAFGSSVQGRIWIDEGAVVALLRNGKSLLPSGVTDVEGCFEKGAVVSVVDPSGREVARGITNYSADEIRLIKGKKTKEIREILGYKDYDEVIHRDNLTVMSDFNGH
ncbi:MAG: Glutamate 5-kinase [Thermoanaerobacterales bacterium 50_218]|nr:MAG: Glutamate 5-kinase [Thermoanaerobacterales bacterium 50_218]HAA90767.1 glutamate 5-kinase [Peptococcaceae bacterium]